MADGDARGCVETPSAIIQRYSRLIHKIANRAARKAASASTHGPEDFYAIGMEACLDAVACYDPTRDVAEAAWVARLVRQSVEREITHAKARGFAGVKTSIRNQDEPPVVVPFEDEPAAEPRHDPLEAQIRWLKTKLGRLNPAERHVIQAALSGVSGTEIAASRGVSKQRIDQMKDQIVARLRRSARLTFHPA